MWAWAAESLQAHAAAARVLQEVTEAARSSGALSAAEATLLSKLAEDSIRGLLEAQRELADMAEERTGGSPALSGAADTPRSDEAAGR